MKLSWQTLRSQSTRRTRLFAAVAAMAVSAQLAGCGTESAPKGQVVAVVNGAEITASEIEAEAMAVGANLRQPGVRNKVLDVVIERHLRAAAATKQGLDKDPRFLAQKRRAEQMILAEMYLMGARAKAEDADIREARTFILRNPALFEKRELLEFDRVAYAPARALSRAEVEGVKSLADAERLLQAKGLRFDRRAATLDPADVPPAIAAKLPEIRNGEVFSAVQGPGAMFAVILERRPAPVPVPEQLARARAILKRQKEQTAVRTALDGLRKSAKISYQEGFGPARALPTGAAAKAKQQP